MIMNIDDEFYDLNKQTLIGSKESNQKGSYFKEQEKQLIIRLKLF